MFKYSFAEMVSVFEAEYYDLFWSIFFEVKYTQENLYKELKQYLEKKWELDWVEFPHYTYRGSLTAYDKDKNFFEVVLDEVNESQINKAFPEWKTEGSFKGTNSVVVNIPARDMMLYEVGDLSHYSVFWIRIQK